MRKGEIGFKMSSEKITKWIVMNIQRQLSKR